jgi:hypothetical protein
MIVSQFSPQRFPAGGDPLERGEDRRQASERRGSAPTDPPLPYFG